MTRAIPRATMALAAAIAAAVAAPTAVLAGPGDTQKGALAATAASVGAWVNYAKKPSSQGRRNTALALTGASAYLWKKGEDERRAESRKRAAREAYHRRRAAYYKRQAASNAKKAAAYKRTRSARR